MPYDDHAPGRAVVELQPGRRLHHLVGHDRLSRRRTRLVRRGGGGAGGGREGLRAARCRL